MGSHKGNLRKGFIHATNNIQEHESRDKQAKKERHSGRRFQQQWSPPGTSLRQVEAAPTPSTIPSEGNIGINSQIDGRV